MINARPAEFVNFSGGITDNYLDGPPNKYKTADNFLIVQHGTIGKLETRPGSEIFYSSAPQNPDGAQRIGWMKFIHPDILFMQSGRNLYYYESTKVPTPGWTKLSSPTGGDLLPASVDTTAVISTATWANHLFIATDKYTYPLKCYFTDQSSWFGVTAGLPKVVTTSITIAGSPAGAKNFIYAFLYKREYKVADTPVPFGTSVTYLTHTDYGAPVFKTCTDGNNTTNITNIPVLANSGGTAYDTSPGLKFQIYRTIDGGQVLYYVGEVTNGTTSYVDTMTDATLQSQPFLYTEGEVAPNDPPPKCKLVHVIGNVGYYANIIEGTERKSNRIRQSIDGDIDSCPEDFYVDVDNTIVGFSSVRSIPVALCDQNVYRIDGKFDELGRGGMVATKISDTASCISAQSVVQTLDGVFWAGKDGFYYTDGISVILLNDDWFTTYETFINTDTKKRRLQGKYDNANGRIWWSTQKGDTDNDSCYVLDLTWGVKPQASFTSISGGDNFSPTAIEFQDGELVRADRRGYIFKHSDSLFSDPVVDTGTAFTSWSETAIIYNLVSCAYNFGTNFKRKFVTRMNVQLENVSNTSLQINSINDDGKNTLPLKEVRYRSGLVWGDPEFFWGDSAFSWNISGIIEAKRRFPARSLRCSYKQVQFTNAFSNVVNSDDFGTVSVDGTLATAVLNDASLEWIDAYVGYYIYFSYDGYETGYEILSVSTDTIVFDAVAGTVPDNATSGFQIKGYRKNEALKLIAYTISYDIFGDSQHMYSSSESGDVSA